MEWKSDANNGQILADGNSRGNRNDQLNYPKYNFIDKDHSVDVSNFENHCVMK